MLSKAFSPIPNYRPSLEVDAEKRESGRKLAHESVAIGKKLAHVFALPGKMTLVHSIPDCTGGEADDLSGA